MRPAGDPDEEDIVYTHLSPQNLSDRLGEMGSPVGRDAIATWLDDAGIRLRQIRKNLAGGEHPDRDLQFERIAELVQQRNDGRRPPPMNKTMRVRTGNGLLTSGWERSRG